MNWIRIATGITRDRRTAAIADACGVRFTEALGCMVAVLTNLPFEAKDGDIADVPDVHLERWAMWEGKRGVFAKAFRDQMCEDGAVRAWEKYNGAAIRKSEADAQKRKNPKETPAKPPRNPSGFFQKPDGYEDVDVTSTAYNTDDDVIPSPSSSDAMRRVLPMVAPTGHMALGKLFANVGEPDVWAGIIRGMASGLNMDGNRPAGPERLAAAVEDFVAQGHHTNPNPSLFRGFVKRAKAPERGRFALQQTEDEYNADLLRTIREQNDRARMRGDAEKPIPTWANRIDATFPDGRTWPSGAAA
jgi:hypothetical protein